MENKIIILCPYCAQKIRVPGNRNVVAKCPKCGTEFETLPEKSFRDRNIEKEIHKSKINNIQDAKMSEDEIQKNLEIRRRYEEKIKKYYQEQNRQRQQEEDARRRAEMDRIRREREETKQRSPYHDEAHRQTEETKCGSEVETAKSSNDEVWHSEQSSIFSDIKNDNTSIKERSVWNKNPFSSKGKLSRLQFFITTSILGVIFVATAVPTIYLRDERLYNMIHNISNGGSDLSFWTLAILANIMVVLLIFAFIKRLRDVNKSPWWLFLCFIPFVVWFVWLYLVFKPSRQ